MDPVLEPPASDSDGNSRRQIDDWLAEAKAGSPSALGRALEACRNYLLVAANRSLDDALRSKAGGSDLVQETFTEAHAGFGRFRGTTQEEFFGWLNAILERRLSRHVRRYRKTTKRTIDRELPLGSVEDAVAAVHDDAPTPGAAAAGREEERRMQAALGRVEEPFRSVLIQRTWERKSFAEIGAIHHCSAEAARKLWTRALWQLQRAYGQIE